MPAETAFSPGRLADGLLVCTGILKAPMDVKAGPLQEKEEQNKT